MLDATGTATQNLGISFREGSAAMRCLSCRRQPASPPAWL